jgi:polyisoprenoid-binding protein YceI
MSQILTVGPAQGDLLVLTGVEGKAARLGHSLTLVVTEWECKTLLEDDVPVSTALTAQLGSLQVRSGKGGAKPLSDRDRRTIAKSAAATLGVDKHPALDFRSTAIADGYQVTGEVTLHGRTRPSFVSVAVTESAEGRRIRATTSLLQSDFGIQPYSQLLGALQVSDEVQVQLEVLVPGAPVS